MTMQNDFSDKMTFDLLCGTDPGDMTTITETDIRSMAQYWNEQGDTVTEEDVQKAIRGLEEYRGELHQVAEVGDEIDEQEQYN